MRKSNQREDARKKQVQRNLSCGNQEPTALQLQKHQSRKEKRCFYTFFVINFFLFNFFDTGEEFLYRNQWGGISLLNVVNLSERVLMSNFTFVSCFFNFIEYLRFKSQLRSTRLEGLNAYLVETCSK